MSSAKAAALAPNRSLDLVFVDGSHSFLDVSTDLQLWAPKLKEGGLTWEDALPVFETVDTLEEIEAAIADPESFLRRLVEASSPAAKKYALAKAPASRGARCCLVFRCVGGEKTLVV